MAVARRLRHGQVSTGNGVVSKVAQWAARIGVERQAVALITSAVAGGGNRHDVNDNGDNHIEEVIHSNNKHPEFPGATGRLEQPVNRR